MRLSFLVLAVLSLFASQPVRSAVIFPLNSNCKFLKGLSEASSPDPTTWRGTNFNDGSWSNAAAPFWYGDAQPAPGTALSDMQGGYTCVFLRKEFVLANANEISELQLGAQSDDGFIAWINGRDVGRFNMPEGEVAFSGNASPALAEPIPFQTLLLNNPRDFLVSGTNVIAIQAFNASLSGSSDFVINVSLSSSIDTAPPVVSGLIPSASSLVPSLTSIEVQFNEAVTGVDASDLLINGVAATNLTIFNSSQYVFDFPQPANGNVSVTWLVSHGIRDLASSPNNFTGGNWSYLLNPNAQPPGIIINEFMADNDETLNDENGDASDWIEIYNGSSSAANLSGWFLTDEASKPRKWRFPNVTLLPNSYLVVFASEKNRTNPVAPLHTNFKLNKDGSYLALLDPQTNVVSAFAPLYPAQSEDVSYGRERGNPNLDGYFPVPTPGAANSVGGPGFAGEVRFSRLGGTFSSPFSLSLTTPSPNGEIRYTLDGTAPTNTSTLYTGPISISAARQVRARVFENGLLPGPPRSESYIRLGAGVINSSSDLPLLIIYNFGAGTVPANADQFAYMALFEPVAGRSSLTNQPALRSRAGINIRGSSTLGYPKSSFSVEWWDEFNDDKNLSVLGMPADSDWVLYAPNNFEPVLIHNPFIFDLSNEIGRYAVRTRFVEVYLNTAGGDLTSANYNGIYVFEEKIKRGKERVDVEKLEPEHINPPEVTGGYMLKIDRLDPGDSGFGAAGQSIRYVDPKEPEIEIPQRDPQEQYIRNYMASFGTALNSASFTNTVTGYPAFVEIDSWIDHHILNVMAFNVDALRLSTYFYKDRNSKLAFGPIWDFDRALGSTDGRDSNPRIWRSQTSDRGTDFFNYPWWGRMFQDLDFWQKWIDRWQELRRDHFALTNLNAKIDALASTVHQAQPREQARWRVAPRGGSYQAEVNLMKSWLASRINFIDTNFLARPTFSLDGGFVSAGFQVTLSGPPGSTLYYTLDGTDPRASGGAISSTAQVYSGPITISSTRTVKARSRNLSHANLTGVDNPPRSTPWSGLSHARFSTQPFVVPGSLAVTELNYHPGPPTAAERAINPAFTNEDFEFLELKNVTNLVVDFFDARFTKGIEFSFSTSSIVTLAPGASLVLVKNFQAFNARYGSRTNVAGVYGDLLDNAGESLRIENADGIPLLEFTYQDNWYPATDGHGYSLVQMDPNQADAMAGWRPSANANGSPGVSDPQPLPISPVLINEALPHTDLPLVDAIEIFNPGLVAVDIGGWFLTDDQAVPRKFRIPQGTAIPAGGFLVFDESHFNVDPAASTNFGLSSLSDEVFLFSADVIGNLGWYAHGFKFGASENGVSFGRHLTSEGKEHFVAQLRRTLTETNAGPTVGPIVINEIMSYPPDLVVGTNRFNNTQDEFVELHNITDATAPLFDPGYPTNTWRLRDAIDYTFPTNVSLPPRGFLLIVSFDPIENPGALASFRARYGLSSNIPIFGPFEGKLDNGSDSVELVRPDLPQQPPAADAGFVPYLLIDRVHYLDHAPWPFLGLGTNDQSLQRLYSARFGNEPTNWMVAVSTPAGLNAGNFDPDRDGDGLPNDWELAHGLNPDSGIGNNGASGDADNDTLSNFQEYLSGTDPRDGASYLKIDSISGQGSRQIRFIAVAGKTYTIQYRNDLRTGDWQTLENVSAQQTTLPWEVADPSPDSVIRFYRLITPQTP